MPVSKGTTPKNRKSAAVSSAATKLVPYVDERRDGRDLIIITAIRTALAVQS